MLPMSKISKTKRTLQNSRVSFLLFLFQIFIGFYARKVFLDYLGAEVLGVHTTLGNILNFLNLAEMGIGLAMTTSLYKPISQKDGNTICEIISVQGILYQRIAIVLSILGLAVMGGIPFLYPETDCGSLYICVSFVVFLSGSIFSYLWNFKQILIQADQKNYKLLPWVHGARFSKIILQIFILVFLHAGIWGWIALEFAGNIVTTVFVTRVVRKEYPWLHSVRGDSMALMGKYYLLVKKTKQLFIHKLAFFVLDQTAPLIIYAFVSLSMVTYYGNYMMLMGYAITLTNVVFDGMGASIGSLIADSNSSHTKEVFWELFSVRIWTAGVICMGLYLFVDSFIVLWIGKDYLLGSSTLLLMLTSAFIKMSRGVIDAFKEAYQLFGDVWAPIIEAVINLGCSLWFGYMWGLSGILLGSNLSLFLVVVIWKPYYLLRNGLKESCKKYFSAYVYHVVILLIIAVLLIKGMRGTSEDVGSTRHIAISVLIFFLYSAFSFSILFLTTVGIKDFSKRVTRIIHHRI